MNECPLSVEHQGNQICTDCKHEADNVAPIVFEDPDISCSILEDIERALVGTYGQCQNELSSIRGYARNPLGANFSGLQFYMYKFNLRIFKHSATKL